MPSDPAAYEVYLPVALLGPARLLRCPGSPDVHCQAPEQRSAPGPPDSGGNRLGVLLLGWAHAAKFRRIVALGVTSAGMTVRVRVWHRRAKTLPWHDVGYLVMWHDERTTSLSVQPRDGTPQPLRLRGLAEPANYVTIRARTLDEQRLLSAVTRYGPAVQIVDGDTGSPLSDPADEHRTRRLSRRRRQSSAPR
jgi:hypothetical protein